MVKRKRWIVKRDGPHPIDIKVGEAIKKRREEMKMSQTQLADALGVFFQQIQKYENGSNRVSGSSLYMIADALGLKSEDGVLNINYFFKDCSHLLREP